MTKKYKVSMILTDEYEESNATNVRERFMDYLADSYIEIIGDIDVQEIEDKGEETKV